MVDVSLTKSGKKWVLSLSGALTIDGAEELKAAFVNAVSRYKSIEIAFAQVSALDITCLQLLCSAHRTSVREGKELTIRRPLPVVLERYYAEAGFLRINGCNAGKTGGCFWSAPTTTQ